MTACHDNSNHIVTYFAKNSKADSLLKKSHQEESRDEKAGHLEPANVASNEMTNAIGNPEADSLLEKSHQEKSIDEETGEEIVWNPPRYR